MDTVVPSPQTETDVDDSLYGEPGVVWEPCATGRFSIARFEIDYDGEADGRFQVALELDDRSGIGNNVSLRPGRNRVTFTPNDLRPLWKYRDGFDGEVPRTRVKGARVATGEWLWRPLPVPEGCAKVVRYELVPCEGRRGFAGDNLFDAVAAVAKNANGMESCRTYRAYDERGNAACRFEVPDFTSSGRYDAVWTGVPVDGAAFAAAHPGLKAKRIVVRARAGFAETTSFQLTLKFTEGEKRFNILLTAEWRDVVREAEFDPADLQKVGLCFGKWLYPKAADRPHAFEIEGVRIE